MVTEAQKKATATWKEKHNLRRVELLIPESTLADVDARAAEQGQSRSKWIMDAVAHALGAEPVATDSERLMSIEAKLDELLKASQAAPASIPVDLPEDTKPKAKRGAMPEQGNATKETPLHRNALSDRDARILELAGLSKIKVAEILRAEGIKCSPRTVGNVRKRFSEGKL